MKGATFDRSKSLPLFARIGEVGVPVILTFLNADGSPHSITPYNFQIPVRRFVTDADPVFTLTLEAGEGLTIVGDDLNKLKVEISEANSEQRNESYFYRLFDALAKHTWLNGPFFFHNGEFDGVNDSFEITNDMEVTIIMDSGSTVAAGSLALQDAVDISDDLFPSTGGSGSLGAVKKGNLFPVTTGGTLDGNFVPAGSLLLALVDTPGQTATNWRVLS